MACIAHGCASISHRFLDNNQHRAECGQSPSKGNPIPTAGVAEVYKRQLWSVQQTFQKVTPRTISENQSSPFRPTYCPSHPRPYAKLSIRPIMQSHWLWKVAGLIGG